jgi:Flp pilus assembly protein TadD
VNRILNGLAAVIFVLVSGTASAAGTDAFASPATDDADYKTGRAAIEAKNWKVAITSFNRAAGKFRDNPDIFNWLGYAHRKSGELDAAFRHYNTALRLDPKHLGAHEYIGEAYLMKRDLASAQKHLTALERLCNKACEEYQDLAKSIAEFK